MQIAHPKELRIALTIEPSRNLATRHGLTICVDLLALMLSRHSDRDIARMTGVDPATIAQHRQRWQVQIAARRDRDDLKPSCGDQDPVLVP